MKLSTRNVRSDSKKSERKELKKRRNASSVKSTEGKKRSKTRRDWKSNCNKMR